MLSLAPKCTGVHPRRGAGVSSGHGGLALIGEVLESRDESRLVPEWARGL